MNNNIIGIGVFAVYILNFVMLNAKSVILPFYSGVLGLIGLLIALIGIIIWITGFLTLRGSFAISPKAKKLVKSGIYRYLRHPIYNGIILTFFGLGLAKGSVISLTFTIVVLYPFLRYRSRLEEKILNKSFPNECKQYKKGTLSLT